MTPDPKRPARVHDPRAGTEKVQREARCRVCGSSRYIIRHHLVPRGQGGDDHADNIIPLCQPPEPGEGCHGAYHRSSYRDWVGNEILKSLTDRELAYIMRRAGQSWLDRNYPC